MAKTADEARKAAIGSSAAFQQVLPSNLAGGNYWTGEGAETNPYIQLLSSSDVYQRTQYFQQIYKTLSAQAAPAGGTMFDQLQTMLRKYNFSKGATPIGIVDPKDIDGLAEATRGAIATNAPDIFSFLSTIGQFGGRGGAGQAIKQPDTTTRYVRQVTAALQSMDLGDASKKYNDAFFLAYGSLPDEMSIKEFQNAWNAEVRQQRADTTTETKIQKAKVYDKDSPPVIDPKTGKQKVDKFGSLVYKNQLKNAEGVLQYKDITTQISRTPGMGFTPEEQTEFMADYLAANFPDVQDAENLGGVAKTIYDSIVKLDQDNYREVSNFASVAPVIREVIASGNADVAQEYIRQYTDRIRKDTGKKYMALSESLAEGQNAADVVKPLLNEISAALETSVDIKDPLVVQMLNFQGSDGTYRLPNELEKNQLYIKDPRFARTSTAINNSVNTVQTLRNRLLG